MQLSSHGKEGKTKKTRVSLKHATNQTKRYKRYTMQSQNKRDLTLTTSLTPQTVAGMLTRMAAHYPNSGHTKETLKIVAEDWFNTFDGKITDRAFIEAVSVARRQSKFFPTEANIFECVEKSSIEQCSECSYNREKGGCANLMKSGFNPKTCDSFRKYYD